MRKLKYPMTVDELNELLKPPEPNETIWPIVCTCILFLAQRIEMSMWNPRDLKNQKWEGWDDRTERNRP